tara:strand:+ start:353 stop:1255 length:903 start_codon:yes stop_codon:yes gene_type:complete
MPCAGSGVLDHVMKEQRSIARALAEAVPDMSKYASTLDPLRESVTASAVATDMLKQTGTLGVAASLKDMAGDSNLASAISGFKERAGLARAVSAIDASGIHDRMKGLEGITGADSALARVAKDIGRQQSALDALNNPIYSPPLHLEAVEHPAKETNNRLSRIEERFDQVFALAKDSAQVATGLQASATEFLQKFQVEADKNGESVNKTIKVAWFSLGAVALFACAQIAAPLFLPDRQTEAMQQSVQELRLEVETLRESQSQASDRLVEALATSDKETAAALMAIAAQLAQQAPSGAVSGE